MLEAGQMLKALREQKGVSIKEIELETKIRSKYLEAIENGEMDKLPGEVYVFGFVRSYLKYLQVDEADVESIVANYKNYYKAQKVSAAELENRITQIDVKEVDRHNPQKDPHYLGKNPLKTRERSFGTRYIWVVLSVIIIAAIAVLYMVGQDNQEQPATPDELAPYQEPIVEPPNVIDPEPPIDGSGEVVDDFDGVKVVVTVVEGSCWVGVTIDGEYSDSTMTVGTTKEFTAENSIKIKYGNAGAVKVEYNGEVTNPLGRRGEVKTVEYMKE